MSQENTRRKTYPPRTDLESEVTGVLGFAHGGTSQNTRQAALNALTDASAVEYLSGYVLQLTGAQNAVFQPSMGSQPSQPVVFKTIDADNIVRFTVTDATIDNQRQMWEEYAFTLYDPTGTTIKQRRDLTSRDSGTSRLRDRWVEFSTAEQTSAGYTPGPTETFYVDVIQLGDFFDSASNKQEL